MNTFPFANHVDNHSLDIRRLQPEHNPDPEDRAMAWQTCWEAIGAQVQRFIRYNNQTSTEDSEIFADTMTITYLEVERGRYQVRPDIPFTAYVKGIARNMILEAYRRDRRAIPFPASFDKPDPYDIEAAFEQHEQREALNLHMEALSPRRREVLRLLCEGHDTAEIADQLGIREDLVRQEKCRAIQQLQKKLA